MTKTLTGTTSRNKQVIDRRSGKDRRKNARYSVTIDIEWETLSGRFPGTMSDISRTGCFILSQANVVDGEDVRIYMRLKDGRTIAFMGRVVNNVFEIGFAAEFVNLGQDLKLFLEKYISTLENS